MVQDDNIDDDSSDLSDLRDHVVICNCNEKVAPIVQELQNSSQGPLDVVLVAPDAELWDNNPSWHPPPHDKARFLVQMGCPTDARTLTRARIAQARAAVILADPRHGHLADPRSTLVAIAIERENPQVHTVMELLSSQHRVHVRSSEVNEIICLGEISEKLIAQSCISPGIKQIFDHLLSSDPATNQLFLEPLPEALASETFRSLTRHAILGRAPFVICGFELTPRDKDAAPAEIPGGYPQTFVVNPRAHVEPGKDTPLRVGDKLIVIAHQRPDLDLLQRPNTPPKP